MSPTDTDRTPKPAGRPTPPTGLQHVVEGLSSFWVVRGCASLPPCNLEITDAFLHPKTFLQLLDSEPWRGVTAQPVSRPRDGRRGAHPFRTSIHLQLQVALKTSRPREVRDRVVDSLGSLGLDFRRRHLRLDTLAWSHDAVGAAGRGWRMSVDGIGIGRITFLQRLADQTFPDAAPTRVDVTYGVEHLAMALTGVDSVFRLPWQSEGEGALRYDQLRQSDEVEQSRYVEEVADVDYLRARLDGLRDEAARCLESSLLRPAYERAVGCLLLLDLLDVRGTLGEREREEITRSVRTLIAGVGQLYLTRTTGTVPPRSSTESAPGAQAGLEPADDVVESDVVESAADESDEEVAADGISELEAKSAGEGEEKTSKPTTSKPTKPKAKTSTSSKSRKKSTRGEKKKAPKQAKESTPKKSAAKKSKKDAAKTRKSDAKPNAKADGKADGKTGGKRDQDAGSSDG